MSKPRAGVCRQLREGLTEYLEEALPPERRRGYEVHLSTCHACRRLAAELRATAALLSNAPPEPVPDEMKRALIRALQAVEPLKGVGLSRRPAGR